MMLTLLKASGFALRGADPAAMKDFVVAVHARAGEATAAGQITSRAEVPPFPPLFFTPPTCGEFECLKINVTPH